VKDHEIHFEKVADGLADHGFAVIDDFLSMQEVNQIMTTAGFQGGTDRMKRAGIGKSSGHQVNEAIRGDLIQWIDNDSTPAPVKLYLDRMRSMMTYLNRSLYLSLKDLEAHMTVYPRGAFYKRHLDQFRADDHRILSAICYLNTSWTESDGGQLRMHLPEGAVDVLPLGGRLVCFRSDQIEHEVLPGTRERYSLTGWFVDRVLG
jgi:SM-20-related protein